jgi:hypothetical protein
MIGFGAWMGWLSVVGDAAMDVLDQPVSGLLGVWQSAFV